MEHSQLFSNASIKGSMLTFLWGSIKSLSFRWLSNDLYLIWKEARDYCKSSGYLLRDFWIPNLKCISFTEETLPNWRCFLSQLGIDMVSPLMLFQGECLLYWLSGFQQRLLCKLSVSEISACQVPLKKETLSAKVTSSGNFVRPAR